jgi:hypothetical protein
VQSLRCLKLKNEINEINGGWRGRHTPLAGFMVNAVTKQQAQHAAGGHTLVKC